MNKHHLIFEQKDGTWSYYSGSSWQDINEFAMKEGLYDSEGRALDNRKYCMVTPQRVEVFEMESA